VAQSMPSSSTAIPSGQNDSAGVATASPNPSTGHHPGWVT